jgi:hypothetical protein
MLNRIRMVFSLTVFAAVFVLLGNTAYSFDSNLVGLLTKNLGVTQQQAEGGSGAIFKEASKNMSAADFATVTDALPEVASLMKAAPVMGTGAMGSLTSTLGKAGGSVSSLAGLTSAFSKLGMGSEMVQKFMPLVLDYAKSKGGDSVANLLTNALL